MSTQIDWANWIIAAATVFTAVAAIMSYLVADRMRKLQEAAEVAKSPLAHIWYNQHFLDSGAMRGDFTVINTGGSPLAIRTLHIKTGSGSSLKSLEISGQMISKGQALEIDNSRAKQELVDIVIAPHEILKLRMKLEARQVEIVAMYYDNSFEFVPIDTMILGGKYRLTGKGKLP
jgi:hypothetical protein